MMDKSRLVLLTFALASLPAGMLAADTSSDQGKAFGKANAPSKSALTKEKAQQFVPYYNENPSQADTYGDRPPRARGDKLIEDCRSVDMATLTTVEQEECKAINYLVDQHDKQIPYVMNENEDPLFLNFNRAKAAAGGGAYGQACQYETTVVGASNSTEEICSEPVGMNVNECEEELTFTPAVESEKRAVSGMSFLLNYGFMNLSAYNNVVSNASRQESPPTDLLLSYRMGSSTADIIKLAVRAQGSSGGMFFANPMPTRYTSYTGTPRDPAYKIITYPSATLPVTSIKIQGANTIEGHDGWQLIFVDNGKNDYLGNLYTDGFTLYAPQTTCSASKCFRREVKQASQPVTSEAGSIIGYGEFDSDLMYQSTPLPPDEQMTFTGKQGVRVTGSRYGQALEHRETYLRVPFYAGIKSANAILDTRTKQVIAYSEGVVGQNGTLTVNVYEPESGDLICTADIGRINQPGQVIADGENKYIIMDDLLTSNWFEQKCKDDYSESIRTSMRSAGSQISYVPAVNSQTIYISIRVQGHLASKDGSYSLCPTYIPSSSSLRKSTLIGETPEKTLQLREDQLTANCTGGRISESQIPNTNVVSQEDYAYHFAQVIPLGVTEKYYGNCESFKRQAR